VLFRIILNKRKNRNNIIFNKENKDIFIFYFEVAVVVNKKLTF